jgi:arylsulfatase A-like enzyme
MPEQAIDRTVLPIRRPPFAGVVNRTLEGCEPDWNQAKRPAPPEDAPNVLLVLIDDAGFGNPSTFGGPINTPNYTRVAGEGLRYNRFHVTAVCSPTRAALLTSRNQHRVGFGLVSEFSGPFPGYNATIPRDCAPFPRVMQENGYITGGFGKWHLTPDDQQGASGPFNRWPNGLGFGYYWGFLGGETGQYDPLLVENQKTIGVPEGKDGKPYYFPDDMAEKTIAWLHRVRAEEPATPWFAYVATGCSHAPHQVPKEWADKYAGKFDQGWDVLREETFARQKELGVVPTDAELTERNEAFPAWDSLTETEKRLYARQMEVYAGYSENADWNIGRILDAIEEMGELDNTLVVWIWGDNGASLEGTLAGTFNEMTTLNGIPLTVEQQLALALKHGGLEAWGGDQMAPHYSSGWAWAGNCPFDWGKQVASHLGGTRNPLVIRYPKEIADSGGLRSHFTHVVDIGPTILEIAGIPQPDSVDGIEQEPMHGFTFADSLSDATAPERHTQQYFEACGNRAMYKDGWWFAQRLPRIPWKFDPDVLRHFGPGAWNPDDDPIELYYLPDDFSQARNIAADHPEKVEELRKLFWDEAEKYDVLPLLGGLSSFYGIVPPIPKVSKFTYRGDIQNVPAGMIPKIYNHSYTISADLVIPDGGAEGVIVAEADHLGGFALFVYDGRLTHTYSMLGVFEYTQRSEAPLPTGDVTVEVIFAADSSKPATGGEVTLRVNDQPVARGRMEHTVPSRFSGYSGMDIGRDNGLPVDRSYADKLPFAFTGTIKQVVFDVAPHLSDQEKQALHLHAQQALAAHGANA